MRKFLAFMLITGFLCAFFALPGTADKKNPEEIWKTAEKYYKEKTYKRAAKHFKAFLDAAPKSAKQHEARYKVTVALFRVRKYDESEKFGLKAVKLAQKTIWEARTWKALGQGRLSRPHYYYEKNGVKTWGRYVQGGKYKNTNREDMKKAVEFLEKSRTSYMALVERKENKDKAAEYTTEWITLDHALARACEWQNRRLYYRMQLASKKFLDNQPKEYNPKFNLEEKILFLYTEAEALAKKQKLSHAAALSLYHKAMYLTRVTRQWYYRRKLNKSKTKDHPARNPIKWFEQLVANYPKSKLLDQVYFTLARLWEGKGKYLKAKKLYQTVIKNYKKSKWATDSQYYIKEMERERISVSTPQVHKPGKEPVLPVQVRNSKKLSVTVSKFDLARFMNSSDQKNNYRRSLGHINDYMPSTLLSYVDKDLKKFDHKTQDKQDHHYTKEKIQVPVKTNGAYLVQIRGQFVHAYQLVVISDLTLVKKLDRQQSLIYVADSFTGRPVDGADVVVKETHYYRSVDTSQGTTGAKGIFTKPRASGKRRYYSRRIQAAAWIGDRYAVSTYGYASGYSSSRERSRYGFYVVTDRPVYRPKHKVNFKIFARRTLQGKHFNVPNEQVRVRIRSPRGKYVFDKTMTTNKVGTLHGSFQLKDKADLGLYRVYTRFISGRRSYSYSRGSRFRVEEYKKPEYEVSVVAPSEQVKLGNKIKAKVKATYYFGAPVVGAKVKYRVQRRTYTHTYYPSGEWDWLYGRGYGMRYLDSYYRPHYYRWYNRRPRSSGELIVQGTGKTNEEGELEFTFDTSKIAGDKTLAKYDHQFNISAEVVDESRRSIKGSGSVKVTRSAFYAYIFAKRGFYTLGDKGTFDLRALTASYEGMKTNGVLKVYKVTYTGAENDKEKLTLEHSRPLKTDGEGRLTFQHKPDTSGRYRLVYETTDKWNTKVLAKRDIWFVGKDFTGNKLRFGSIEILTDKRNYRKGEVAHVMINTNRAGAAVLLSQEVSSDVMKYTVLQPKGKSAVVDIKITQAHAPNFFLSGLSVHSGQVHVQNHQVFVPPVDHLLKVKVKTDRSYYRPGEEAEVSVHTYDYNGKPTSAEVNLAVVDQAVYYIQGEFGQDVRKHYYGSLRGRSTRLYNSYRYRPQANYQDSQPNYGKIYRRHGMPYGYYGVYGYGGPMDEPENESIQSAVKTLDQAGGGKIGRRGRSSGAEKKESAKLSDSSARSPGAPSPTSAKRKASARDGLVARNDKDAKKSGDQFAKVQVRKKFSDTAHWSPVLVTNENGVAKVKFKLPDNLTTWRITAKALTKETSVGQVVSKTVTKKNVLIRLQAPRFFTEKDQVILSGIVHNYFSQDKDMVAKISLEGGCLKLLTKNEQKVKIKAGGVFRANWKVQVVKEGTATIRMTALSDEESDAQELKFPVYVYGVMKYIAKGGSIAPDGKKATVALQIPKERRVDQTRMEVVLTPSLASAMLDALPYLSSYPYGCVEQTMSRFLPSVVTATIIKDLGVSLEKIAEKRKELNAKHLASHPWRRYKKSAPTFSTKELNKRVQAGLKRLYTFQHSDGGWGWWRYGRSDVYMSAYVTYGLYTAMKAGYKVQKGALKRAVSFLQGKADNIRNLHRRAYVIYVLSHMEKCGKKELEILFKKRDKLNLYSKALLAMSLHNMGRKKEAQVVCRNLEDFLKEDKSNGTAWFEAEYRHWWYWYNDDVETNAFILKAFSQIRPKDEINPKLVKWILGNRKGVRWKSTKTTAFVIYALADYMKASQELNPDYTVSVKYQGKTLKKIKVTKKNALFFDNRVVLTGKDLPSGASQVTIEKEGKGRLYFNAYLEYFTREDPIKGAGNEIFVKRTYYKLIPKVVERKVGKRTAKFRTYEKVALKEGASLKSGDLVEVKLEIEAKNNYEYLMFEDRKAAGMEAVALKSGRTYANGLCSNMELRDEKVVFFISWLQQGTHTISYKLRAEIPGTFYAMPTYGEAMYAPKVKAISDSWKVEIKD